MFSLYYNTNSLLHRTPTWLKLTALAIGSVALFWLPQTPWSATVVALPVVGYLVAKLPLRVLGADLARMSLLLVFLVVTQLIFNPPEEAITVVARLTTIILAAQLFTRTTTIGRLMATVEKIAGCLKIVGVNPKNVALAVALMLSALGQISGFITQVRQAQRARGVRLTAWAWVVPVLVLSLKHADDVADALTVRGLDS